MAAFGWVCVFHRAESYDCFGRLGYLSCLMFNELFG